MIKFDYLTLDEWKNKVLLSSHVKRGEVVKFSEPDSFGYISANIYINEHRSVFLGTYFTKDEPLSNIKAGMCWFHE